MAAKIKPVTQLTTADVHSTNGSVLAIRKLGRRVHVHYNNGVTKTYWPHEHVSVQ